MMQIIRKATELLRRSAETTKDIVLRYINAALMQLSRDWAIKHLRDNTFRCFFIGNQVVDWGNILQPDGFGGLSARNELVVRYRNVIMGHVSIITSRNNGRNIKIGHFAVSQGFVGTGVAIIMARVLREKFREHYNTRLIIFDENHTRFDDRTYTRFFSRLGAVNPDVNQPRRWEWDIS